MWVSTRESNAQRPHSTAGRGAGSDQCRGGRLPARGARVLPEASGRRDRHGAGDSHPVSHSAGAAQGTNLREPRVDDLAKRGGNLVKGFDILALITRHRPRSVRPRNRTNARSSPLSTYTVAYVKV